MARVPDAVKPVLEPGALARTEQPVLGCDELVLRPWQAGDAAAVAHAYSQPDIQQWLARSMNEREAEAWIRSRRKRWAEETGADWAVTDRGGVVGRVGLRDIDLAAGMGETAYWVLAEGRGAGVASRALCAMTDWAFDQLGLHRIELTHATENVSSCRVAQIACYELEGTMRQQALHRDGWHDTHLHARLAGDPRPDLTRAGGGLRR